MGSPLSSHSRRLLRSTSQGWAPAAREARGRGLAGGLESSSVGRQATAVVTTKLQANSGHSSGRLRKPSELFMKEISHVRNHSWQLLTQLINLPTA